MLRWALILLMAASAFGGDDSFFVPGANADEVQRAMNRLGPRGLMRYQGGLSRVPPAFYSVAAWMSEATSFIERPAD